jgi:DNA-binding transcriptional LysR family regulator
VELRQLRQFLAVAETLNFHKAAERLHIAQPPLSMAIRRLETSLGAQLFDRSSHCVVLTAAGRAALEHARDAVFHADLVRESVTAVSANASGTLRVHFVASSMMAFVPRTIARFHAAYPKAELDLHEADTHAILQAIEVGDTDIGVVRFPTPKLPSITMEPVLGDRYIAALPAQHRLAKRKALRLIELRDEPFILPSQRMTPTSYLNVLAACHHAGFSPRIAQQGSQAQTIIALVESGLGVALVPKLWQLMAGRSVALRPLAGQRDGITGLGMAYRSNAVTPLARRFLEFAKESIA